MTNAFAGVLSVRRAYRHGRAETIDWRYARTIRRRIAVVKSNAGPSSAPTFRAAVIQSRRQQALTQGRRTIAGRPRHEAKRVTGLEEQARSVEVGMFKEMPKRYLERPDGGPLCQAWNDALDAAALARLAMQKLGAMLRKSAQITEPGPHEELILTEGQPYESTPEGWNLASACVELVRRRARVDCDPGGRTGADLEPPGMG